MKDYKRLTEIITASNTGRKVLVIPSFKHDIIEQTHRLADIEDKIESGEIDYVADKVKEIERLTAENKRLREEAAEQKSIAEHEHATQMEWFFIACDYKAKNDELRERLEKAVILPCKFDDTVWCIRAYNSGKNYLIEENNVIEIVFDYCDKMRIKTSRALLGYDKWTYGWDCFTDRAEAEARLKELQGGKE